MPPKKSASTTLSTIANANVKRSLDADLPASVKRMKAVTPGKKAKGADRSESIEDDFSPGKCIAWFQKYAEKKPQGRGKKSSYALDRQGMAKFCAEVGILDDDVSALLMSHKLGVKTDTEPVSQVTWLSTMKELGCDSDEKFKRKLPGMLQQLKSRPQLLALCEYAFNLMKQPGDKVVSKAIAVELFSVMLKSSWPLFRDFTQFFQKCDCRSVSLDTFAGICDLASRHPTFDSLETYDATLAWPSLADEFVEYVQKAAVDRVTSNS